jgi:hypothetical protein
MLRYGLSVVGVIGGLLLVGSALFLAGDLSKGSGQMFPIILLILSPFVLAGGYFAQRGLKSFGAFGPTAPRQPKLSSKKLVRHLDTVAAEHIRQLERDAQRRSVASHR